MSVMGILAGQAPMVAKSALVAVPHDPATDIVYALVGFAVVAIWYGNRRSQTSEDGEDRKDGESGSSDRESGTGEGRG